MSSSLYATLRVGLVCLILIALLMGGCADSQHEHERPDVETSSGPVISHDTVFYKTGPEQATPPDGTFKAGTRIEVIQEAGSYTLVRAQDGTEGYISSAAINVPADSR